MIKLPLVSLLQNEPLTAGAEQFAHKMFQCEKPCDSYGVCDGCIQKSIFQAGYNLGYRANGARPHNEFRLDDTVAGTPDDRPSKSAKP